MSRTMRTTRRKPRRGSSVSRRQTQRSPDLKGATEAEAWTKHSGVAEQAVRFWNGFLRLRMGAQHDQVLGAKAIARILVLVRAISWVESRHGTGAGNHPMQDPMQCGNPRDAWWKELTNCDVKQDRFVTGPQGGNYNACELPDAAAADVSFPDEGKLSRLQKVADGHKDSRFNPTISYFWSVPIFIHKMNTEAEDKTYQCRDLSDARLIDGAVAYNGGGVADYRKRILGALQLIGGIPPFDVEQFVPALAREIVSELRDQSRSEQRYRPGLARYLATADLQIETDTQRREVGRALRDLMSATRHELTIRQYADHQGLAGQWTAADVIRAHLYSKEQLPDHSLIVDEVAEEVTRHEIERLIEALERRSTCEYHPGRPSAGVRFGKQYCQRCIEGMEAAVRQVDKHVEPKGCFVVYTGSDTWRPISGTGCAHWAAHQKGILRGESCVDNKTLRVPELVEGTALFERSNVSIGDIWANEERSHCGLVVAVASSSGSPPNRITIRHDSSAQGGVVENDFDAHFHGKGTFHR